MPEVKPVQNKATIAMDTNNLDFIGNLPGIYALVSADISLILQFAVSLPHGIAVARGLDRTTFVNQIRVGPPCIRGCYPSVYSTMNEASPMGEVILYCVGFPDTILAVYLPVVAQQSLVLRLNCQMPLS